MVGCIFRTTSQEKIQDSQKDVAVPVMQSRYVLQQQSGWNTFFPMVIGVSNVDNNIEISFKYQT